MTDPTFPMDIAPLDDEELWRRIARELARRGWRLATEPALFAAGDSFHARVQQRLTEWRQAQRRGPDDKLVEQAIVHEYCRLLHAALSEGNGRLQNIAVDETIAYGWPLAHKHYADRQLAEAAILRAVHKVWLNIHKVQPGSYLAYFTATLLNEFKQDHRKQKRDDAHTQFEPLPDDVDYGDEGVVHATEWRDPAAEEDFEQMFNWLAAPSLQQLLRDCLKNPRREHIILLHFFFGFNASDIARQLQMAAQQISMEKFRALERIRECCAEEFRQELQLRLSVSAY